MANYCECLHCHMRTWMPDDWSCPCTTCIKPWVPDPGPCSTCDDYYASCTDGIKCPQCGSWDPQYLPPDMHGAYDSASQMCGDCGYTANPGGGGEGESEGGGENEGGGDPGGGGGEICPHCSAPEPEYDAYWHYCWNCGYNPHGYCACYTCTTEGCECLICDGYNAVYDDAPEMYPCCESCAGPGYYCNYGDGYPSQYET